MSTPIDTSLFIDVADAIGLGNPAIVEKDYYVVQLLKLISRLELEHHKIVFTGGTALAKSAIKTYRMSEDIDLKLVPTLCFQNLTSRSARRRVRKAVKHQIELLIAECDTFLLEGQAVVKDEYSYFSFGIRYPQAHQKAPCLRPFIKLELIESELLIEPQNRSVQSIYAEVLKSGIELETIACADILETQAEKMLSMMRRTASAAKSNDSVDDETLIRHIYDIYQIQNAQPARIGLLGKLVAKAISIDNKRYGRQYPQMLESPIEELRFGLMLLADTKKFEERYNNYIGPMVYAERPVKWSKAIAVFTTLASAVLDLIEKDFKPDDVPK